MIRKGELAKAALYLDRQLESTADKQERAELASSRLILHHFTQDFKGYYKTLETHLPILQEDIRTSQGERKYYLNSLLLGGLTYGSSLYPTREVANDSFLQFERERNGGFDIPSLGFYTTTIKSSVAWRFGELDFSYDLLYRAGALLANEDIRSPLSQLALVEYARVITYQICDFRELRTLYQTLKRFELLDFKSALLAPHVKANLLGFFYDSGMLSRDERKAAIETLRHITNSLPVLEQPPLVDILSQREAVELLLTWVSRPHEAARDGERISWIKDEAQQRSIMAKGVRLIHQVMSGKSADKREINALLENWKNFVLTTGHDSRDFVSEFIQRLQPMLESLIFLANGDTAGEVNALNSYVQRLLKVKDAEATWVAHNIHREDMVSLTADLYVARRLSLASEQSPYLAELLFYIAQSLSLSTNSVQIQTDALFSGSKSELQIERSRAFNSLLSTRLLLLERTYSTYLSQRAVLSEAEHLERLRLQFGLLDLHEQLRLINKSFRRDGLREYKYFSRLSELTGTEGLKIIFGTDPSFGVAVSTFDGMSYSKFWTENDIKEFIDLRKKALNRQSPASARDAANSNFWSKAFSGLHKPSTAREINFLSGGTLHGLPVSIATFNGRFLIDTHRLKVVPNARYLSRGSGVVHRDSNRFEYAFFGIGDPQVLSDERLAALESTERLIRGPAASSISLQPLPDTAVELRSIVKIADGPSLLALGEDATKKAINEIDLSRVEVLSLATHGVLASEAGLDSPALLLTGEPGNAESRFLTLDDINQLVGISPVVLLSACNTATRDSTMTQGALSSSLLEGFLSRGSELVISSHWSVDSASTADLMKEFAFSYYGGSKGDSAAEKFWDSVRLLKTKRDDFLDWGAFVPVGDYRRVSVSPGPQNLIADRLWIYDATLTSTKGRNLISLLTTDRLKDGRIVSGREVFDLDTNTLLTATILQESFLHTGRLIRFSKDYEIALWTANDVAKNVNMFRTGESEPMISCMIPELRGKTIADVVTTESEVFLALVEPLSKGLVVGIDPLHCKSRFVSFSLSLLKNAQLDGLKLLDFASGVPRLLVGSSTGESSGTQQRTNVLSKIENCDHVGGLTMKPLSWDTKDPGSQAYISGYLLPEALGQKESSNERQETFLRYSDTCTSRNYVTRVNARNLREWSELDESVRAKRRIPMKTFFEVEASTSAIERSLKDNFSYVSTLDHDKKSEQFLTLSQVVTPLPGFSLNRKLEISTAEIVQQAAKAGAFYQLSADGEIGSRIRSGIGCPGGFFSTSISGDFAVIGCRSSVDGNAIPNRIEVYRLPSGAGEFKGSRVTR